MNNFGYLLKNWLNRKDPKWKSWHNLKVRYRESSRWIPISTEPEMLWTKIAASQKEIQQSMLLIVSWSANDFVVVQTEKKQNSKFITTKLLPTFERVDSLRATKVDQHLGQLIIPFFVHLTDNRRKPKRLSEKVYESTNEWISLFNGKYNFISNKSHYDELIWLS